MHSRSGDTACFIGQCKGTAVYVDLHTGQRIDQRHRIGSACLCCTGDLGDIRYVRRQLHDHRLLCDLFDLSGKLFHMLWILTESKETSIDVRTGNVDLHHVDLFLCQPFYHSQVFFRCMTADIDDDLRIVFLKEGNISFTEYIDTGILKPYGIHHTTISLCHSGSCISRPGNICHTFGHNGAQTVEIHKFTVFLTGAKGSGGCHHRILQFHTGDLHTHICHHTTSVERNTGPSLHTRLLWT